MKTITQIAVATLGISSLMLGSGCTTTGSNAESGAVAGALVGALIGGVIGNNVENGHNDYYNNPHYYERHRGHYHDVGWDDDNGGAEGALIGAAAGALIGGIIGAAEDDREQEAAAMRAEELRLQRELAQRQAEEDAAYEAYQTKVAVSHGMGISDNEVTQAEKRAREAELRLQALQKERLEALKREQRYTDAETRRMEAEQEIERLERELAGYPTDTSSTGDTSEDGQI